MADRESNFQLAKFWVALDDLRGRIDNELLPLAAHLGLEDADLTEALEALSERVGRHFGRRRLVAERRRGEKR